MADLKWVETRCNTELLPDLEKASTEEEVKVRCQAEIAFWQEKFDNPNSWRTPHTQSRKIAAASNLSPEKKAWVDQYLSLGSEKWKEVNKGAAVQVAARNEHQILLKEPDRIVVQAETLLASQRWQDIAAGLAVCTGRRSTEILKTAQFEPATAYSVIFSGQLKHDVAAFEIPTLAPADKVLDAFQRLRAALDVADLGAHDVSNSYHKAVTASVKRHFELLIPAQEGETINTQDMRAVYIRLAIFFYAPVLIDSETYAAEISGHRNRADSSQRSYGAGAHYSDYKIADRDGNIDGRQGVKLNDEGVKVLSVFSGSYTAPTGRSTASRVIAQRLPETGILTPEALFTGEILQLVRDGMEATNTTDFLTYLTQALKRQAKNDLGVARRDTVANVAEMSMDDLLGKRKHSTAVERVRRGVAAIAAYNDSHSQMERWFINTTLLNYLIGGRFETILEYVREHQAEIDSLNSKYGLIEKYNRKPMNVKEDVKKIIPVE